MFPLFVPYCPGSLLDSGVVYLSQTYSSHRLLLKIILSALDVDKLAQSWEVGHEDAGMITEVKMGTLWDKFPENFRYNRGIHGDASEELGGKVAEKEKIEKEKINDQKGIYKNVRVKLANETILKTKHNKQVTRPGYVAGT